MNWIILPTGFVEVSITKDMVDKAESRNKAFYKKCGNAGTHRTDKGRQRMTGYLAEQAVKLVYPKLDFSDDATVDFVFQDVTFDVKSQGCNSAPGLDFAGTLYEEQQDRKVDFLIFTRVKNDFTKAWITGFIRKDKFLSTAKLIPAGTANNNFRYDQSRFEIAYRMLTRPQQFMSRKSA
jgi:hypothetical protein